MTLGVGLEEIEDWLPVRGVGNWEKSRLINHSPFPFCLGGDSAAAC